MKPKFTLLIALLSILSFSSFSQNEISLLNGKKLKITDFKLDTSKSVLYYKLKLASGKVKTRSLVQDEVFSITDSTGEESVIYSPAGDEALTVSEMRDFVKGYGTGRLKHQSTWAMIGGFAVGFGGMFAHEDPFLNPLIPAAYCGGISLVKPNTDYLLWNDPDMELSTSYIAGYQDAAHKKNIKYAVIGSLEGILIGTLVAILTDYYN